MADSEILNESILCERCGETYKRSMERCPACRAPQSQFGREIGATARHLTPDERRYALLLPEAMVTTLPSLPGFRISQVHGVVAKLSGNSGFTATTKGNNALEDAMVGLRSSASSMGGNAIVGLTGSSFGAGGGITNALGGDAVGILLLGTSVTVVREGELEIE